jgi:hypothetical protein
MFGRGICEKYQSRDQKFTGFFLARMQLHACRFRLAKKKTHWIRAAMCNFQFLDSIWHQNYKKSENSKAESRYIVNF